MMMMSFIKRDLSFGYILATSSNLGPEMCTFLFHAHCMSLYGCALWKLSSPSLRTLEVTFKNCFQ